MTWLRVIVGELVGLFVDDGRFAGAILLWVVLCALALPRLALPTPWGAVILFAGLLAILLRSALGRAGTGPSP